MITPITKKLKRRGHKKGGVCFQMVELDWKASSFGESYKQNNGILQSTTFLSLNLYKHCNLKLNTKLTEGKPRRIGNFSQKMYDKKT